MKTKLLIALFFITSIIYSQRTYMPDDVFEAHMIRMGKDDVLDDYVPTSSIAIIKTLNLGGGIVDPTGIEDFATLESLNFSNNDIQNINLSELSSLKYLNLSGNKLQTIDVGLLINLEYLNVSGNEISSINVAQNNELTQLYLAGNKLKSINTKFNGKLERLSLSNNLLTSIDISSNTKITNFSARENNGLTTLNMSNINYDKLVLNISKNPNLYCVKVSDVDKAFEEFLQYNQRDPHTGFSTDCSVTTDIPDVNFEQTIIDLGYDAGPINGKIFTGNVSSLTSLTLINKEISDLSGIEAFVNLELLSVRNNNLTTIDLSSNSKLTNLTLDNNLLTTFNASANPNLVYLSCNDNLLTSVDIKLNPLLDSFWVNNNKIADLDFSNQPNLRILEAKNNLLTNLNITSCKKMERVDVAENKLTALNLFSNKKLERLYADDNAITTLDVRLNIDLSHLTIKNNYLHSLSAKNGFNSNMYTFETSGNSDLFCIEVDDVAFSNSNWTVKDAQTSYSTDCAPANDECKNAIPLVFDQETPGDVISGNSNNNPTCVVGTVLADVWYSFTVPQTGKFSIEGTGFGGQLKFAVYENCINTNAIACGDAISLTNLTVGKKLYLKVWLETAAGKSTIKSENGTFTIKAKETNVLSVANFIDDNSLSIFPNPASETLNIHFNTSEIIKEVKIYNILGGMVLNQKNQSLEKTIINVSSLKRGVYFIKIIGDKKEYKNKIVIK